MTLNDIITLYICSKIIVNDNFILDEYNYNGIINYKVVF